ncbi:MAG: helix-turn-helix domain-containing protein, partial [Planctomycetaceae bacterium]
GSAMLSVRQVAERLNVSRSCVYELISSGKIPHHRIGKRRGVIRVTETGLQSYLDSIRGGCVPPTRSLQPSTTLKHLHLGRG